MRRRGCAPGAAVVLVLLALLAWWFARQLAASPPGISAANLTPAPTPPDARRVAVMTLAVTSDAAGAVVDAELLEGFVEVGYAPNVANRPGAWTASLMASGQEALRFGIPDPRQVRVEGGSGDAPHTSAFEPEVEVTIVIPLADAEGRDLSITDLRLYDQAGNLIFDAGFREGKIFPIPVRQVPAGAAG